MEQKINNGIPLILKPAKILRLDTWFSGLAVKMGTAMLEFLLVVENMLTSILAQKDQAQER
jgi:hypothetical protein